MGDIIEQQYVEEPFIRRGKQGHLRVGRSAKYPVKLLKTDRAIVNSRLENLLVKTLPITEDERYSVQNIALKLSQRDQTRYMNIPMLSLAVRIYVTGSNSSIVINPEGMCVIDIPHIEDYTLDALGYAHEKGKYFEKLIETEGENAKEIVDARNKAKVELLRYMLYFWETMNPTVFISFDVEGEQSIRPLSVTITLGEFWEGLETLDVDLENMDITLILYPDSREVLLEKKNHEFIINYGKRVQFRPEVRMSAIVISEKFILLDSIRKVFIKNRV